MRPIRDRWWATDPANFFLAAVLLVVVALAVLALSAEWNPWLFLVAAAVVPLWAVWRRHH
jgi:hypothetical protein